MGDIAGCVLASLFIIVGCALIFWGIQSIHQWWNAPKKIPVTAQEFGDRWPLTVAGGHIYKREASHGRTNVIFVAPDGTQYGLNGTAQSAGYPDIHRITKYEVKSYGLQYQDVGELIDVGLSGNR